jgi:tRNA pseudouridine32 synthase/23S rRNA pseudouridine746 synthase
VIADGGAEAPADGGDAADVPPGIVVIHADSHLLVLDKPSGLLAVPAKPPGPADCLEARARAAHPGALLVHRLDRDTSGVMVFALTRLAQRHLGWQFERRQVAKDYVARVAGHVGADAGRVELPLIADWPNRPLQMVDHVRGRAALTDWQVLAREPGGVTRLALTPLTGRSHQLRVHCASLGHPILGDNFYAPPAVRTAAPRLQLHAARLAFRHPNGGERVAFTSAVPF